MANDNHLLSVTCYNVTMLNNKYYNEDGVPFHSKEEADRCIKGTNGNWKKIVSVSDEIRAELAEVVKQDFIAANGWGKPDGSKKPDVINKYLKTLPSEQSNSAAWTLQRMAGDYATRMEKIVRENNPGWKPEDSVVRAYGNLYDEIVQGYKNGTRERYAEDENSETGFRKMTMCSALQIYRYNLYNLFRRSA